MTEQNAKLVAEIVAIPEDGHRYWPSGLHPVPCHGCEVRSAKRRSLITVGIERTEVDELLPLYGRS